MRVETDLREILNSTLDQLSRDVHEATEETLQLETEYGDSLLKDMVYACDFLQPLLRCETAPAPAAPEKQESAAEELDQGLGCNDEFTMKELAEKVFQDTFDSSDVDLHTKHPKKRPAKCSEIKKHPPSLSTSTPSKMPLDCKKLVSKMEFNSKPAHCMPEQHQKQQKPKCQPTPQQQQQPQQQQCRKFSKLLLLGRFEAVDSMSLPSPAPGFPHTSPQQYPGLVTMQPQSASYDLGSGPKLDVRITFSPDCSPPSQPQQSLQAPLQHQQSHNACSNRKQSAHQPLCAPAHHAPGHHGPLAYPCKPPAGGSAHGLAKGAPSGGSGVRIKMTSSSKLCVSGGQQSAEMCQAGEMSMEMPQHGRGTETKAVQVPEHRRPAAPEGSQTGFHFTQTQQFSMGNMEQRLEAAKTHLKSQSQPHQSQHHQPQHHQPQDACAGSRAPRESTAKPLRCGRSTSMTQFQQVEILQEPLDAGAHFKTEDARPPGRRASPRRGRSPAGAAAAPRGGAAGTHLEQPPANCPHCQKPLGGAPAAGRAQRQRSGPRQSRDPGRKTSKAPQWDRRGVASSTSLMQAQHCKTQTGGHPGHQEPSRKGRGFEDHSPPPFEDDDFRPSRRRHQPAGVNVEYYTTNHNNQRECKRVNEWLGQIRQRLLSKAAANHNEEIAEKESGIGRSSRSTTRESRSDKSGISFKQNQHVHITQGAAPQQQQQQQRREKQPAAKEQRERPRAREEQKAEHGLKLCITQKSVVTIGSASREKQKSGDRGRPKGPSNASEEDDYFRPDSLAESDHPPSGAPSGISSTTLMQCQLLELQQGAPPGLCANCKAALKGQSPSKERGYSDDVRKHGYSDRLDRDCGQSRRDRHKAPRFQKKYDSSEDYEDDLSRGSSRDGGAARRGRDKSAAGKKAEQSGNDSKKGCCVDKLTSGNKPPGTMFVQCQQIELQHGTSSAPTTDLEGADDGGATTDDSGRAGRPASAGALATTQQQTVQGCREARQTNVLMDVQFDTCLRNTWKLESTMTPLPKDGADGAKATEKGDKDGKDDQKGKDDQNDQGAKGGPEESTDEIAQIKEQLELLKQDERRKSEQILKLSNTLAELQRSCPQQQQQGARMSSSTVRSVGQVLQLIFRTRDEVESARGGKKRDACAGAGGGAPRDAATPPPALAAPPAPEVREVPAEVAAKEEPAREAAPASAEQPAPEVAPAPEVSPGQPCVPSKDPCAEPLPRCLQIENCVGEDSLLIGWEPPCPADGNITGFELFVDSELKETVKHPQRTHALLTELDLTKKMCICVRAVTPEGPHPSPATVQYSPPSPACFAFRSTSTTCVRMS